MTDRDYSEREIYIADYDEDKRGMYITIYKDEQTGIFVANRNAFDKWLSAHENRISELEYVLRLNNIGKEW